MPPAVDPGDEMSPEAKLDPGLKPLVPPLPEAKNLTPSEITTWTLREVVPYQSHPRVPATLVGLIWARGPQPWGAGYEHDGRPLSRKDYSEYKFGFDGSSPYAVYFVSDGRGINFRKNWSVGLEPGARIGEDKGTARYDAAMFQATTPNDWGLSRIAHVVDVDVNDKRGGVGIHFVITNARVIDGTPAFPPQANNVLIGLRARFNTYLVANEERIRKTLDAEVSTLQSSYRFGRRIKSVVGVFPTWNTSKKAMDVVFTRVTNQAGEGNAKPNGKQCPPCPPGAPCMLCREEMIFMTPTADVAVLTAVRYVVDKTGEVVEETHYLPMTTKNLGQKGGSDFIGG